MDQIEPRLLLKVTPPRVTRRLLDRSGLALSSPLLRDRIIIRLEAPAGFGKTALLSQWRRAWLASGAAVAWLGVDADDDGARFAQGLALAMERATGRAAFGRLRQAQTNGAAHFSWLTEWLSEVADAGTESVLILDEVEDLPGETQIGSLDYLLRNLPPNLRVVMASRRRLRLRLPDLAARGVVAQLGTDSLRFTLADTVAILQAQFEDRIGLDAAARIHDLTQGWPLGLQLLISALEQGQDVRQLTDPVARRRGGFERGFFDSLVAHMPVERRDFLIRTSVLRRLHPALCIAVTGRADSRQLLVELSESTPLLSVLEGDWYAVHPMARDFLRDGFEQLPAQERGAVHAAACIWLEQNGGVEEAAGHALHAGLKVQAWELAEKSLFGMLVRGEVCRVQAWFDHAPLPKKEQRPRLLLAAGWSYALGARYDDAVALGRRVLSDERAAPEEKMRATLLLAAAAIYADKVDEAARRIEAWYAQGGVEALNQAGDPTGDRASSGVNQLAWLALVSGDPAQARRLLQQALAVGRFSLAGGFKATIEGLVYLWEGNAATAAQELQRALQLAEAHTSRRDPVTVTLAGVLAYALWECGEAQQAEVVLANRLDAIETLATPSGLVFGYIAAARIARSQGQEARAYELLAAVGAVARQRHMHRVLMLALAEAIRMHALAGHGETCAGLLIRMEQAFKAAALPAHSLSREPLQLCRTLAKAYALSTRGDWTQVLALLEEAGALAQKLRRGGDSVEIQLLRARALQASGREYADVLREAVQLADTFGLKAMIGEAPIWNLRRLAVPEADSAPPAPAPPVTQPAAEPPRLVAVAPTPLLTPKERDILGLLVRHMSNKQIAAALDVGDATIKWHLKNVFSKLHAVSRDHAVQRARMLGILEMQH